jgi:hypothetical protein
VAYIPTARQGTSTKGLIFGSAPAAALTEQARSTTVKHDAISNLDAI